MNRQPLSCLAVALWLGAAGLAIAEEAPTDQAQTGAPSQTAPPETQTAQPPGQTTPSTPEAATPATPPPAPAKAEPTIDKVNIPDAPPAELKKLSRLEGVWTTKTHLYASPMGPESDATGKTTFRWVMGGMHLDGSHDSKRGGKPVTGRTTWGWDPEKKQYQIVWLDSRMPGATVYYGTMTGENSMLLYSTYMIQGKAITQTVAMSFPDANTYTLAVENDMSGEMKRWLEEKGTKSAAPKKATTKKKTSTTSTTKKPG